MDFKNIIFFVLVVVVSLLVIFCVSMFVSHQQRVKRLPKQLVTIVAIHSTKLPWFVQYQVQVMKHGKGNQMCITVPMRRNRYKVGAKTMARLEQIHYKGDIIILAHLTKRICDKKV